MTTTDGDIPPAEDVGGIDRRAMLRGTLGVSFAGALAGCQSILGGEKPDDTTDEEQTETEDPEPTVVFSDDWEDGTADGWETVVAGGDGSSQVRQLSSPDAGTGVLSLSQSAGSGTEYILATENDFDVWDEAWTLRTAVHTTDLDPSENYQKYEIIPGYDEANGDDPLLAFRLGIRDGDYDVIPAQFTGEAVESESTYELDWAEDEWHAVEIAHDGDGAYTGTVWPEADTRPAGPNVEASADVSVEATRPLALHINGPSAPEFRLSHAFIELTTPR